MDGLIKRFAAEKDNDLMLCEHRGVAYQRDMNKNRTPYDEKYLATYNSFAYKKSDVAKAVNAGRIAMLKRHAPESAKVLDVGAASCAFINAALDAGYDAKGFDIIPDVEQRLKKEDLFSDNPEGFDVVTFWDSLEHIEEPANWLRNVKRGALLLVAVPIMTELKKIRESKHYKFGEHLYYWTDEGFINYMALYEYRLIEKSTHETDAGRSGIGAYVFVRDIPDYRDHIAAYVELHFSNPKYSRSSATELYLQTVAQEVRRIKPKSILDYGCGRSDISAHFWNDGTRYIERYDPAIIELKEWHVQSVDLALCLDVMEHIPMLYVDKVFSQIKSRSDTAIFAISTKLARAKLPDGRNSHVTLLTKDEWINWIKNVFGNIRLLKSNSETELVLITGTKI